MNIKRRPQEWMDKAIINAAQAEASQGELGWGEDSPHTAVFVDRHIQLSLMYSALVLADKATPDQTEPLYDPEVVQQIADSFIDLKERL